MNKTSYYLAVDLGASSGRCMLSAYDGQTLTLEELNRFPNAGVEGSDEIYWDSPTLFKNIKEGIAIASQRCGDALISVGVDTWGVDYGLLDKNGELIGNTICYRDPRTNGMMEEAYKRFPKEDIYKNSGIQLMFFNTIFQLLSEVTKNAERLEKAERLLFMPDLINYWLSGKAVTEFSIASTSQLMDMSTGAWSKPILEKMGIPENLLTDIVPSGTTLGNVLPEIAAEAGLSSPLQVIAVGGHDTASAIAAVPASIENYAYMSSGTWSLMGLETQAPIITDKSYELALTNEGGICNTIRLLKNITGLWLIQECKRQWDSEGDVLSFADIVQLAEEAKPFIAVIDSDHESFQAPCNMPQHIQDFCKNTKQEIPLTKGEIARVALEALALKYRSVIEQLDDMRGERIEILHIVGGGTQNTLLNQMAADAIERPVVAGPIEATAIGNVLMQMIASGTLSSLQEGRELVRKSFDTTTYQPHPSEEGRAAFTKLKKLL